MTIDSKTFYLTLEPFKEDTLIAFLHRHTKDVELRLEMVCGTGRDGDGHRNALVYDVEKRPHPDRDLFGESARNISAAGNLDEPSLHRCPISGLFCGEAHDVVHTDRLFFTSIIQRMRRMIKRLIKRQM